MATKQDRAVIDLVINGESAKTSLKAVSLEVNRARSSLLKMQEADDPALYKAKVAEYQKLVAAQRQMRAGIDGTTSAWQNFKRNAASVTAGVLGGDVVTMGLAAIRSGIGQTVTAYREFNAASKELSAVTGATGADLDYLNQAAKSIGPSVGKSGAEMLEAFKLMASAKPELLEQKELLVETTKAAITLAQAGKIDLAEATQVTAESLNQFGEGADQANRFINVIAAGAKEGSAEINEMSLALKNSGTVAAAQGVSFEQTNAVLQSLSTIALKGGEAGTQLRNVLLTLGSGSDDTNPKVVGLEKALENLGKKNLSTAELTKLFGKENITAAQHIIAHRNEISELTEKVTDTQEAFTQAQKNNESFDHQLEVFWSRLEGIAVLIGSKVIPAFTGLINIATTATKFLTGALTPASEAATQAFEEQRTTVRNLERNLAPLLTRHDELAKKSVLSKDEQTELKKIIGQVADIVPGAATGFDKYGQALDINTGKARDFIAIQRELLKYANREAIDENKKALANLEKQQKEQQGLLNSGGRQTFRTLLGNGQVTENSITMSQAQLSQLRADLNATSKEIDAKKQLLSGLTGDYLNTPTAAPPAAPTVSGSGGGKGGGLSDEEKRKRDEKITANQQAKLAIEEMNVKAIADDKERELAMAKFRSDQEKEQVRKSKANADLKATWLKGVDDALKAEQLRIEEKFTKQKFEEEKKRLASVLKTAENELLIIRSSELAKIKARVQAGGITKEQGQLEEMQIEQRYLFAKEVLYVSHYDTLREKATDNTEELAVINEAAAAELNAIAADQVSIEGSMTAQQIDIRKEDLAHAKQVRDEKMRFAKDERDFRIQMMQEVSGVLMNDWTSTITGYKDFWRQATVVQKAALIAQKAWALAEIGINLARQLMLIQTAAAVMNTMFPGSGFPFAIQGIAKAVGNAGLQTAAILAMNVKAPAFADGGYTGAGDGPAGFVNSPTLFEMGRRRYVAGEAGREFVISNRALQNPVVANFAGMLDVAQRNNSYSALYTGAISSMNTASMNTSPVVPQVTVSMAPVLMELQALRQEVASQGSRPVGFNYHAWQDYDGQIQQIKFDNTIKHSQSA